MPSMARDVVTKATALALAACAVNKHSQALASCMKCLIDILRTNMACCRHESYARCERHSSACCFCEVVRVPAVSLRVRVGILHEGQQPASLRAFACRDFTVCEAPEFVAVPVVNHAATMVHAIARLSCSFRSSRGFCGQQATTVQSRPTSRCSWEGRSDTRYICCVYGSI